MKDDKQEYLKFKGTEVNIKPNETESQLIRRFIRMTKREGILDEYIDATKEYIKPSVADRLKRKRAEIERLRREKRAKKKQQMLKF